MRKRAIARFCVLRGSLESKKKYNKKTASRNRRRKSVSGQKVAGLVRSLAEPLCESEGLELVHVEFQREASGRILRLYIDKPDGIKLVNPKRSIPDLAAFKNGWFQVQDEAAQLVSLLLDPQPGESVLDACAGLGGKTAHIAQLMQNKGSVAAMDKDARPNSELEMDMPGLNLSPFISNAFFPSNMLNAINPGSRLHCT